MTNIEAIYNCDTDTETTREYTQKQISDAETNRAIWEQEQAELQAKQAARSAVLTKLGLTAEEAQALLG